MKKPPSLPLYLVVLGFPSLELLPPSSAHAQAEEPPPPALAAPPEEEEDDDDDDDEIEVSFGLFADAYVGYGSSDTGTPAPYHRAYTHQSPEDPISGFPGYSSSNFFNLSFVGLDATFDAGTVGATAIMRFGPSVPLFYGIDEGPAGIDSILGGYVSILPTEALTIDIGYFGTIYGAEVAESWMNLNYTRGGLYFAMQPFYHLGAKAAYAVSDAFGINVMLVNGANALADDDTPAAGLQFSLTPSDVFSISLGGYYDFNDDAPSGIETFADAVAALTLGDFTALLNFDFNMNRAGDTPGDEDTKFWGISLAAGYTFNEWFGIAARGEYLSDNDGTIWTLADGSDNDGKVSVVTTTLTLDFKPYKYLIVRAEGRYEKSTDDIYFSGESLADDWFSGVLGVVATTNP